MQEFWIKCVTPVRVQVSVTFVEHRLLSYHPHVMTDFTLVDFPRTYFGTKIMKTMLLINKGPAAVMYCSKVLTKTDVLVRILDNIIRRRVDTNQLLNKYIRRLVNVSIIAPVTLIILT